MINKLNELDLDIKRCEIVLKENNYLDIVIAIEEIHDKYKNTIDSISNISRDVVWNYSKKDIENIQNYLKDYKDELILKEKQKNIYDKFIDLKEYIEDKDFSINVISKSGTTTEPAIAFRMLRKLIEEKYGLAEARKRIFVTTDKEKGALKKLAKREKYETFVIPNSVGGRYSVLTAVGLLPIAVAGINIDKLMEGARIAQERYNDPALKYNECYQYAVARNILYKKGNDIEILANYEPRMHYITEWWKQLFGESEGKDGEGI